MVPALRHRLLRHRDDGDRRVPLRLRPIRHDLRASPRQSDLMIVPGTINEKIADRVKVLYDQMAEPRWVLAMGGCAINGGPYHGEYNIVDGVDKVDPGRRVRSRLSSPAGGADARGS